MSHDPVRASAARISTLIAVPVAAAVFALFGWRAGVFDRPAPSTPATAQATAAVPMAATSLTAKAEVICRALIAKLPDTIGAQKRRPVSGGPEQNAAYGDPAITLACGTPPAKFSATDRVDTLDGVCWFGVTQDNGTQWTTVDRTVPVTVVVPGPSAGSAQSVIGFSAAIAAAVPRLTQAPSGCG